jgi:hypothetical protein
MDEETADQASPRAEQRRGTRFPVVVFVEAKWQGSGGKAEKETAQAMEVSALGGLLDMRVFPGIGSQLELTNLLTRDLAAARVVGTRRSKDGASIRVAVELLTPSETFWGLNFQLRKTSAELVKIEQAIKSGGVDPRILGGLCPQDGLGGARVAGAANAEARHADGAPAHHDGTHSSGSSNEQGHPR